MHRARHLKSFLAGLLAGAALVWTLPSAVSAADGSSAPPKTSIRSQGLISSAVSPEEGCKQGSEYLARAMQYYRRRVYNIALELAKQVHPDEGCSFTYLQSMGLIAGIYVHELEEFEQGIAAARKGLELDPRQTALWFTRGYAQYQLDSYREAIQSFQQVLKHFRVVPVPASTLIEARYLIADSTERNAHRDGLSPREREERLLLAVTAWQEYEDFCMDADCPELHLQRASERIESLSRTLQMLRLKMAR